MELNKILIGVVLVGVISSTFLFFITQGITIYNPSSVPTTYANSFSNISASMSTMNNYANETEQDINQFNGNTNAVTDFIGFFFGNGFKAVKTFIQGMKLTNVIVEEGVKNTIGGTEVGQTWKLAILTIITISLIAIILHFVIKSERL